MGAVLALPVMFVASAGWLATVLGEFIVTFVGELLFEAAAITSFSAIELGPLWGLTLFSMPLALPLLKRDDGYAGFNHTRIKFTWHAYDKGTSVAMKFGAFDIVGVDNLTGIAEWGWQNNTQWTGTMTNLWLDDNSHVAFPPLQDDGTLPWYPNGTMDGQDYVGHPVYGNWTTRLNKADEKAFDEQEKKARALENYKRKYPGRRLPYFHITTTPFAPDHRGTSRIYKALRHVVDPRALKREIEDHEIHRDHQELEKGEGFGGNHQLVLAMKEAFLAHEG